jgi:hypothetical protein
MVLRKGTAVTWIKTCNEFNLPQSPPILFNPTKPNKHLVVDVGSTRIARQISPGETIQCASLDKS